MAVPNENKAYEINLEWDLSEMPDKSSGVWTYGEGKGEEDRYLFSSSKFLLCSRETRKISGS
ncbi:hypothetical protein WKH37_00175 [Bacillus subtilis]|uniref:hypothetical protein n=1 Tax=Bacillus subtilis TaxID=1423 RepID=UPI002DBBE634|nr:hypothetical protein [Bacillus subtilis]MEC1362076.1 hypothetical protein [Bacillus subtilis]MEC1381696.1 hypothetical protein [Bacillus subtilis]